MLQITPLNAFTDNYIWLLSNADGRAIVVDPGDATPVMLALGQQHLTLDAILVTHHHDDHTGGILALQKQFPALVVYGPKDDRLPQVTHPVQHGAHITIKGFDTPFSVLATPGHTLTHISWLHQDALFCGDTLFSAGCGRVFEGTMAQMEHSLRCLASLPSQTQVFAGHEYTLSNLKFALEIEPDNKQLQTYSAVATQNRDLGKPTLPSTIMLERQVNPFLRTHAPQVVAAAAEHSGKKAIATSTDVFTVLRRWKDSFRG